MNLSLLKKAAFYFPSFVFSVGIFIHIQGFFLMDWQNISLWILWVHSFMLCFNIIVVIGLLKKRSWGYYPAFFFSVYFILNQTFYLILFLFIDFNNFDYKNSISLILFILVLLILWMNPEYFGIKRKPPFFWAIKNSELYLQKRF